VLAANAWDEEKRVLQRYVKKSNLKQHVLLDGGALFDAYGGSTVPTVLFINKQGTVVDVAVGFGGPGDLITRTEKLLASG